MPVPNDFRAGLYSPLTTLLLVITAVALSGMPYALRADAPPVGPGSGKAGSMSQGLLGPSGYGDMGNGEAVDTLTGDLVVAHPVAVALPTSGELAIDLARVYRSRSAESRPTDTDNRYAYPYSWVGYRWMLHMGRITVHGSGAQTYYVYEGPGGDEHRLFAAKAEYDYDPPGLALYRWYFTSDGSFIRAHFIQGASGSPYWIVQFPDGSQRELKHYVPPQRDGQLLQNADQAGWYTTLVQGKYQTKLFVTYYAPGEVTGTLLEPSIKEVSGTSGGLAPRKVSFALSSSSADHGGPEGVNLLHRVTWTGYGGAARSEVYRYATLEGYDYPYHSAATQVPVLISVTRDPAIAGGERVVAYDYAHWDEMAQDANVGGWNAKRGLRLSDIYYPTGLRSHYEYAQDQYLWNEDGELNQLPPPPPFVLSPDTENWAYHSGVGVAERWAVLGIPDPLAPYAVPTMDALKAATESTSSVQVLKWTWNRRGLRDIPHNYAKVPFAVTADPLGREVVHLFNFFSRFDGAATPPQYPTVSPLETETRLYSQPVNMEHLPQSAGLVKVVRYDWSFYGDANGGEPGDLARCDYYSLKDGSQYPVEGNAQVTRIRSFRSLDQTVADISVENRGWDGYGHFEQTVVTGVGIPRYGTGTADVIQPGEYKTFQSFHLLVTIDINSTWVVAPDYHVMYPQVNGALFCTKEHPLGELTLSRFAYDSTPPPPNALNITQESYATIPEGLPTFESGGRLAYTPCYPTCYGEGSAKVTTHFHGATGAVDAVSKFSKRGTTQDVFTTQFVGEEYGKFRQTIAGGKTVSTRTLDGPTGLVLTETDENDFVTTMEYDALGRLLSVTPPAGAGYPVRHAYPAAAGSTVALRVGDLGAQVSIPYIFQKKVTASGPSLPDLAGAGDPLAGLASDGEATAGEILADGLGRTWLSRALEPGDTVAATFTAYGADGRAAFASLPYREPLQATRTLAMAHAYRDPSGGDPVDRSLAVPVPALAGQAEAAAPVLGTYASVHELASESDPFPAFAAGWGIDPLGEVRWVIPPVGPKVENLRTAGGFGRLALQVGAIAGEGGTLDSRTFSYYNALGWLIGVDAPEGSKDAIYDYDVNGQVRAVRLVDSIATATEAGGGGEPPNDPDASLWSVYAASGVDCFTGGQVRNYLRDATGRVTTVNDPAADPPATTDGADPIEQGTERYLEYDALGNVRKYQDAALAAEGATLNYTYDARGRLTAVKKQPPGNTAAVALLDLRYDAYIGTPQFPSSAYPDGANALGGRLAQATYHNWRLEGSTWKDTPVTRWYRYAGPGGTVSDDRTEIAWKTSEKETRDRAYWFEEGSGRLAWALQPDGRADEYAYRHGALAGHLFGSARVGDFVRRPSGALEHVSAYYGAALLGTRSVAYDAAGRVSEIGFVPHWEGSPCGQESAPVGGIPEWHSGAYAYDGAGNIEAIGELDRFRYDAAGRLVHAQVSRRLLLQGEPEVDLPRFFRYEYDAYGNLLQRTAQTTWLETGQPGQQAMRDFLSQGLPALYQDLAPPEAADAFLNRAVFSLTMPEDPVNRPDEAHFGLTPGTRPDPYLYDRSGRVIQDRAHRYTYDPLGRQTEARDDEGTLLERYLYDPSGERVGRVAYDSMGAATSVTTTLREGGAASWEEMKATSGTMARHRYMRAGGGLFMDGGESKVSYQLHLPATPEYVGDFAPGAEVCVPGLSEPSWALAPGGSQATVTYAVTGLCDDIAWVEVRKSRIKDAGKAPCGGRSCEDDLEVLRFDRPAGGWGTVSASFARLQGGKAYQFALSFASDAAGHPLLGPLVFSAVVEVVACPRAERSVRARMRTDRDAGGPSAEGDPAWRFAARSLGGYILYGLTEGARVEIGRSAAGEDIVLAADVAALLEADALEVAPIQAGLGKDGLPGVHPVDLSGPPPVDVFVADHLGTVRAVYRSAYNPKLLQFPCNRPAPPRLGLQSTHDYEPFGVELFPTDPTTNTHKFTGQERDDLTGNDNLHFRFYQDSIGRFLKPDNIAGNITNPQSWNRYSYVQGNPVNMSDPSGHIGMWGGSNNQHYKAGGWFGDYIVGGVMDTDAKQWSEIDSRNATAAANALINQGLDQSAPQTGLLYGQSVTVAPGYVVSVQGADGYNHTIVVTEIREVNGENHVFGIEANDTGSVHQPEPVDLSSREALLNTGIWTSDQVNDPIKLSIVPIFNAQTGQFFATSEVLGAANRVGAINYKNTQEPGCVDCGLYANLVLSQLPTNLGVIPWTTGGFFDLGFPP